MDYWHDGFRARSGMGIAAAGVGCLVLTFPFAGRYRMKAAKAIDIYNMELKTTAYYKRKKYLLEFGSTSNGIGMKFNLN